MRLHNEDPEDISLNNKVRLSKAYLRALQNQDVIPTTPKLLKAYNEAFNRQINRILDLKAQLES